MLHTSLKQRKIIAKMKQVRIFAILFLLLFAGMKIDAADNTNLIAPAENSSTATVKIITKADFLKLVMDYEKNPTEWKFNGNKPCIIDFYADWCAPCRITSPILEELAVEYSGKIDIYKVNVDKERELSQVFGVSGIPAFLYCPMEGKPSMTSGIAKDKEQTKQMFKTNIETILLKKK
jgi:thioredoxin